MDPDVIKLFGVMLAIMVPVGVGVSVMMVADALTKRLRGRPGARDADALERLQERVDELERREARVQEIEERLDFVERVLPGLREGRPSLEPPRPTTTTPV